MTFKDKQVWVCSTRSLTAPGERHLPQLFNIDRDIPGLRAARGKRTFTQVTVSTADEAAAASEADIDLTAEIREGAPNTFLHTALMLMDHRSEACVSWNAARDVSRLLADGGLV